MLQVLKTSSLKRVQDRARNVFIAIVLFNFVLSALPFTPNKHTQYMRICTVSKSSPRFPRFNFRSDVFKKDTTSLLLSSQLSLTPTRLGHQSFSNRKCNLEYLHLTR